MRSIASGRRAAFLPLCTAMGLLMLTAACGSASPAPETSASAAPTDSMAALVEAATKEGSVLVYTSLAPLSITKMEKGFEKKYPGIDVVVERGNSTDTIPRVETELSIGKGDAAVILETDQFWMNKQGDAGSWLDPSGGPSIGGEKEYDSDKYLQANNVFAIGQGGTTFGWNTKGYPKGLKSYTDLLDPALKGKIGLKDAASSVATTQHFIWMEENFGKDFTAKLAAQEPRMYNSTIAIGEALNSGEILATDYVSVWEMLSAQEKGAPVEYGYDKAGIQGSLYFGSIPKSTSTPNAARLFADYVVSKDGQVAIFGDAGAAIIPGVGETSDIPKAAPEAMTPEENAAYVANWKKLFGR